MNGKLIVAVLVLFLLGYVFSQSPQPTPDIMASDYATTIATVATVAAYESLSPPKDVVQDSVVEEVVQEVSEQMEVLSEPVVQEFVIVPVSQTIETEVIPETNSIFVEQLDDAENAAWEKLNDMREKVGLKRLTFAEDLLDGCRTHANNQRKRNALWHVARENCAACPNENGEQPIKQWYKSDGHRRFMFSASNTEGAIGRSGNYWVFRARPSTKTVTITQDTGNPKDAGEVEVKERSVQNGGNSCVTGYATDGQRTVKTYTRTGRHRPLRYALWRVFN
ncbi:MAG: CAP domain-containing protein [Planctomycetaceae bacterium]|jgi:uncharacterized protein YkwD|nr:CAP domain-containing protein [Planctomycetaceae bacterium]